MFDSRYAQLYFVFYYGVSGSSLAAEINAGRLKKPLNEIQACGIRLLPIRKGWLIVISFFMPLILCLTVVLSVGIGVLAAYAAVFGILQACSRASQPQMRPVEARPRLVLVPTQNHASGD